MRGTPKEFKALQQARLLAEVALAGAYGHDIITYNAILDCLMRAGIKAPTRNHKGEG